MLNLVSDRMFQCSQLLHEDELGMSYSVMVHIVRCDTLSILCLILGNFSRQQKSG
jgi:hypothetical protein